MENLKSCPLCSGIAELHEWECSNYPYMYAEVSCTACGASGPVGSAKNTLGCFDAENGEHKKQAICGWNTRHNPK